MRLIKIHTSELMLLANLFSPRSTNISSPREYPVAQVKKDIARLSSVGEIVITIHQQEHGVQIQRTYNDKQPGIESASKVPEKVLKGDAKSQGTA
jgi:hypothetical protein